jgi:predicted nucleotidyltransferase
MNKQELQVTLAPVVDALRSALGKQLIALVLFGSRARGEADESSDWDILLIVGELPEGGLRRHFALKRALPPLWRGRISLLAKTQAEFEARLPALYLDIAQDGVILYDSQGYAARRLARIRRRQVEAGLQRQRQGKDLIWIWATPPVGPWRVEWEGVDGIRT